MATDIHINVYQRCKEEYAKKSKKGIKLSERKKKENGWPSIAAIKIKGTSYIETRKETVLNYNIYRI